MAKPPRRARTSLVPIQPWTLALLAIATVVTFSPALRGPQVFDDLRSIQFNPTIADLGESLHPPAGIAVAGRPLVNLTLAIDYRLNQAFGDAQDPAGAGATFVYHLTNLAIHLLAGLFLFGILRRTLASDRVDRGFAERWADLPLVVTALWLLHPLQTEPVDYLIQRTESLAGLCYLATLYLAIRAWDAARNDRGALGWYLASVVICALGMTAKETMVTAPLLVLLYDRVFELSSWRELTAATSWLRRIFYPLLFATLIIQVVLQAGAPRIKSAGFGAGMTSIEYLVTQGWAIPHYLWSVFIPSSLSVDYGEAAVPLAHGLPGVIFLLVLAGLVLWTWRRLDRFGAIAFSGAAFFLLLAPSSSVIPVSTEIAADRRMYLALVPVLLACCLGIDWLVSRRGAEPAAALPRWVRGGGIVAALVLAALSFERSRAYADPASFWSDGRAKVPGNPRAWFNAGIISDNAVPPRRVEADSFFQVAVGLDSTFADAAIRLTINRVRERRYDDATAILKHVDLQGNNLTSLHDLAQAFYHQGDTTGALVVLNRIADDTSSPQPMIDLIGLYESAGRDSEEVVVLRRADKLFPNRPDLLFHFGAAFLRLHHPDSAAAYLERVAAIVQNNATVYSTLGRAYAAEGRRSDAASAFARALRIDPNDSVARAGAARP